MSHLLLAEKHQQLLLKNAESRPIREVHSIQVPREFHATSAINLSKAHVAKASRRPSRGYTKRPTSKPQRYVARGTSHKPKPPSPSKSIKGNCHKCGRKGHYAKECRASSYVVELYREIQRLQNQPRENYNYNIQPNQDLDIENYMTSRRNGIPTSNIALLDNASMHTMLTDPRFIEFPAGQTSWQHCKIITMVGCWNLKFQEGRTRVILPGGFPLICNGAMYAPEALRSLINYKDLRANNIHISTTLDRDEEVLELRRGHNLFAIASAGDEALYRLAIEASSLISLTNGYEVCMAAWAESLEYKDNNLTMSVSNDTTAKPDLWHRHLRHPGETMFRQMLPLTVDHNLNALDVHKTTKCIICIQGKFSIKPSKWHLPTKLPPPLYRIHGDVCRPINPPFGAFGYFFVVVDASGIHFEVSLLPTYNMVFPRLLGILIRSRNHFPDFSVKYLRMDNAQEFRSHTFEDYCVSTGITLTYSMSYEHSHNGLG